VKKLSVSSQAKQHALTTQAAERSRLRIVIENLWNLIVNCCKNPTWAHFTDQSL
jgi:hypothetical protein